jgi:broad specificity phosphatase PhoE
MYLYLVRHGETDWNHLGRIQGRIDTPLNSRGLAQAQRLAARLAEERIECIYTSPLVRARTTAEIIGSQVNQLPISDERLIERDPGKVEGLTLSEIEVEFPAVFRAWRQDSHSLLLPGAENQQAFCERVSAFLESMQVKHPREHLVVVTHGGTLAMFFAVILGLDINKRFPFRFDNTSLSRVDFSGPRPRIDSLNDSCHLRLTLPEWRSPLPSSAPAALEAE